MTFTRLIIIFLIALLCGSFLGWWLRPILEDDPSVPMAEYGGSFDYGFNADITWHPESELKGSNIVMYKTTWKWTFHNRTETPIQFSIPKQRIHIDRSVYSSSFVDLPESMHIESPIIIKPNEKRVFTTKSGEAGGTGWNKAKNAEYGFQIVAKIDNTFHILECAANIHKAPMQHDQLNETK